MKRVRLVDVAEQAGVSASTVSLVLAGRARELRISEAVEKRVLEAAESLQYRSSRVSASLRTGITGTIGFVSDTVATSQLAGDMITGAIDAARERGMMLLIGETKGWPDLQNSILQELLDRQVDGIIFASMFTRVVDVPAALARVPAVLLNGVSRQPTTMPSIVPDEFTAGRDAVQVLLDAGHREQIHIVGVGLDPSDAPPESLAAVERVAGIDAGLAAVGLTAAGRHGCADWLPDIGYRVMTSVLAGDRPRAVICLNDRLALGVLQALDDHGLRVPDDVSLVSFDDQMIAQWTRPHLTTVALPHAELGRSAVTVLAELMAGATDRPAVGTTVRIPMPLRLRDSVAAPRV